MNIKQKIYSHLLKTIKEKIIFLENNLLEIKESISNETKSTAGDKYETSRAMLHLEQENIVKQLWNANDQKKELENIDIQKSSPTVTTGSFVITTKGSFFMSIGFGKVEIDSTNIIALSLKSSLGNVFSGKKVGDSCVYGNQIYVVTDIF